MVQDALPRPTGLLPSGTPYPDFPNSGLFANYSYQWKPVVDFPPSFSVDDVNWPAKNRFNAGFGVNHRRYLGSFSLHFTDEPTRK